jgi:DNA repair protein RadC
MKTEVERSSECRLLRIVLKSASLARRLARAPGGWRSLSEVELGSMGLSATEQRAVLALQTLTRHSYPELPRHVLVSSAEVARVYGARLGGHLHEVIVAVAVDGQHNFLGEVTVAEGGAHGACIRPADVLRPMIRAGASGFILVHNHPSSDPRPSPEDIEMTEELARAGNVVGIPLLDHVVVAARGGRYASFYDIGLLQHEQRTHQ